MFEDNNKIHIGGGHITLSGAKFFGKIISSMDWFKLN